MIILIDRSDGLSGDVYGKFGQYRKIRLARYLHQGRLKAHAYAMNEKAQLSSARCTTRDQCSCQKLDFAD